MRRRLLIFLAILFFIQHSAFSADFDEYADLDKAWENQGEFSNQKYEQVINALEEN